MGMLILLILVQLAAFGYTHQWMHEIYVDTIDGVSDNSCWEGGFSTSCLSLDLALTGVQYYNHSTAILLQPGNFTLQKDVQLWNKINLAIIGNGRATEVFIKCQPLAGLAFFNSSNISLKNINLDSCGASQSAPDVLIEGQMVDVLEAMHFLNCEQITIMNVGIQKSCGTGLGIYNTVGVVSIKNTVVREAREGGVNIVFSNHISKDHKPSHCTISGSQFTHNTAGRGGGISVVFRGGAAHHTVLITDVLLDSNMAQFGGGIAMMFYDGSNNNQVTFEAVTLTKNIAASSVWFYNGTGGGMYISLVSSKVVAQFNNTITVTECNFSSNIAKNGGGLAIDVSNNELDCTQSTDNSTLIISKSLFDSNMGFYGMSLYLAHSNRDCFLDSLVHDSKFNNGSGLSLFVNSGNVFIKKSVINFIGSLYFENNMISAIELYASSIKLFVNTRLVFSGNEAETGAALKLTHCSNLIVNNGSFLIFEDNSATTVGGAMYIESCDSTHSGAEECFIQHANPGLSPAQWNITFYFDGNTVSCNHIDIGNSIYIDTIANCVNYNNYVYNYTSLCWKLGWLDNNKCQSNIETAPIYFCDARNFINITMIPGESITLPHLCNELGQRVKSLIPNKLVFNVNVSEGNARLKSESGPVQDMQIILSTVQTTVTVLMQCPTNSFGTTNNSKNFSILDVSFSQSSSAAKQFYSVQLESCENGYSLPTFCSNSTGCGVCLPSALDCTYSGSINDAPEYCAQPCPVYLKIGNRFENNFPPFEICNTFSFNKVVFYNTLFIGSFVSYQPVYSVSNIPNESLSYAYLLGKCDTCIANHSISINSFELTCIECTNNNNNGVMVFFLLGLLPVAIMMVVMAVLGVNITDGRFNGFVLYSQLATVQFSGVTFLTRIDTVNYYYIPADCVPSIITVFSMWNLNFFPLYPFYTCFQSVNNVFEAIILQYIIALIPLLFIVLSYYWIMLYNNSNKIIMCISKPVHKALTVFWNVFSIKPSLIGTYAGMILLSYMKLAETSVRLLHRYHLWNDQCDSFHGPLYGVIAIVCLVVFIVPPLVILLFYHFQLFHKFLSVVKLQRPALYALVDSFQGCFKCGLTEGNERRYFAGVYLLFRLLVLFLLLIEDPFPGFIAETVIVIIMCLLLSLLCPYKKVIHNINDFLILMVLAGAKLASYFGGAIGFISGALYIPFFVLICYIMYRMCQFLFKSCIKKKSRVSTENAPNHLVPVTTNSSDENSNFAVDDLFPDRVLNPGGYD